MPTGVSSLAFYGHLLARYYVSYRFYYLLLSAKNKKA